MFRWQTLILLIGCCAALAGQRTYYVSYRKDSELTHRIYLQGDTFGLEIKGGGLMPTTVSERKIRRSSDDMFTIVESMEDSSRNIGVWIDNMAKYDFYGKTFRQEDSQLIDITSGRPYVNEDTINNILGDFPLLIIHDGKRISWQTADSIHQKEGKRLNYSTMSGEKAYKAFGPAGIKGAIIMKSKK
ncbi:MAG: hypothetical protein K2J82_05615 [Muribaculaceae bacterium]|nr:hypothetical protein [Muribaculaceae bacterium]